MSQEIQIVSDGDSISAIGDAQAAKRFLASLGLKAEEFNARHSEALAAAGVTLQAGSTMAQECGRWAKITADSAQKIKEFGLMTSKRSGLQLGAVQVKERSGIKGLVEFEKGSFKRINPGTLAGLGTAMLQMEMELAMQEIQDYLATIDAKVDDVLRAQKDAVLSNMIGVEILVDDAMDEYRLTGHIYQVTWEKIQSSALIIAQTQAYALRQLEATAESVSAKQSSRDLLQSLKKGRVSTQEWLAVLARSVQLQDASAMLELDRVQTTAPDELDQHRLSLKSARGHRLDRIASIVDRLAASAKGAGDAANRQILLHPSNAPASVELANEIGARASEFSRTVELDRQVEAIEARPWKDAAQEAGGKLIQTSTQGLNEAKQWGTAAIGGAVTVSEQAIRNLRHRLPAGDKPGSDEPGAASAAGQADETSPDSQRS
ncbi:hypothetical protein BACT_0111 [Bifidobacterium actinocoloniiforme DSM 22766]|uniref:Uncharacterized protein n=1 Tax=Bifidobacterium actinocoloniiforme DSM 22766 TaxID=1437605 RepID=A0A086YYD1_9BIFI|nr:hypothetical protein [Bifidobacterium actinocoloniiforme]AKV55842.1 hypothetical protein AB656_06380 [Bifidobacterium actinocoloniiforme DSM 22766]KFI39281.1 hypothetical protein BACT_0111 [Bifidobacterium actinocoloniiforme DSM 22766]